ncbi:hypothetical protein AALP_AAs71812U000100 [Arabis alpina]|uniref:Uncharacterized protein n=1 Tax=Arabis alpina TaxID=50452 RepID=A0A087G1H5_ARAAL|nr:hypothetical protein AALP_AAs71812U000100 [Arabis alpina]
MEIVTVYHSNFAPYSPNIKEIKVVSHRKVRKARLYYLRDKLPRLSTFKIQKQKKKTWREVFHIQGLYMDLMKRSSREELPRASSIPCMDFVRTPSLLTTHTIIVIHSSSTFAMSYDMNCSSIWFSLSQKKKKKVFGLDSDQKHHIYP